MPGFGDYIVIFGLALILFGPKKMPELARQLGKLMGEFRRASNEFKMQMEEEMRVSERAEQEKKVAALEAAAPPPVFDNTVPAESENSTPEIAASGDLTMRPPETGLPVAQSAEVLPVMDEVPLTLDTTEERAAHAAANTDPGAVYSDAVHVLADSIPAVEDETSKENATHG